LGNGENLDINLKNAICDDADKSLEACINFTRRDVLNFMHFSKTGGTSLSDYMVRSLDYKPKADGTYLHGVNLCAQTGKTLPGGVPNSFGRVNNANRNALKSVSRCTWDTLRKQPRSIDFIFGHQYRLNGAESILPSNKNVRTFTVMRHPMARKISFFYHFLVRAAGRSEKSVKFEELRDFLVYDKVPKTQEAFVVRHDIGPNYMTGRMLSDGNLGFVGTQYHTYFDTESQIFNDESAENAVLVLKSFLFIGLQSQRRANMCMLRKTISLFKKAHGVKVGVNEEMEDTQNEKRGLLNSGSYPYSFKKVKELLSEGEISTFESNEHADLRVYEEGVRLFHRHTKQFGCESHIRDSEITK